MNKVKSALSRRTRRIFLSLAAASAAALFFFVYPAVSARHGAAQETDQTPPEPPAADGAHAAEPQGNGPADRLDAELITARPNGFEPSEITRADGRFLLMLENRSGIEDLSLKILRQNGERLHETRLSDKLLDWRGMVNLPPGHYVLTESKHPAWRCQLVIGN
jgi:hypothetical protein